MTPASPRSLLALCATAAALAPAAAAARVVGADDRVPLDAAQQAPFSGVGRLVCRDPASGDRFASTATLVGDRSTLLTTGHFARVQTPAYSRSIPIDFCAFELRSAAGARLFASPVTRGVGGHFTAREQPSPFTPDWAILKLATPAPASAAPALLRPMSAAALARRADAFMVSYHSIPEDAARTRLYSPGCKPLPVRGAPLVFSHSCDTESGSSGGLVFVATRSGPRAVGINHGSAVERNYGQIITAEMLRSLPSGAVDSAP